MNKLILAEDMLHLNAETARRDEKIDGTSLYCLALPEGIIDCCIDKFL